MELKLMRFFVSGRVQGVAFRYYTLREAEKLGLRGWVKNLADGRVELLVLGHTNEVKQLFNWAHHGPPSASVEQVEISREDWISLPGDKNKVENVPSTFEIEY